MTNMAAWTIFLLGLLYSSSAQELTPFIAWSNRNIVKDVPQGSSNLRDVISHVLPKVKGLDAVIIFVAEGLTFDDFNKLIGVYGDTSSELETAVKESSSSYWTGVLWDSITDDWISRFVSSKDAAVHYLRGDAHLESKDLEGVIVIELDSLDNQDDVIGKVMRQSKGLSYLAMYTSTASMGQLPRSRRDVPLLVEEREIEPRQTQPNNNSSSGSCDIGGALPQFNTSTPCLLFCLSKVMLNITVEGMDPVRCSLGPQQYRDLNFTCGDMNTTEPSVTVLFEVDGTVCNGNGTFNETTFAIKFSFPKESSTGSSDTWHISIDVTWIRNDPRDICQFDGLERTSPSSKLYYPFSINDGLSYACSAKQYNNYAQANASSPGQCSGNSTAVYLSYVLLDKLQVQPYSVGSNIFASAYNCEGYFTATTWMGVFAVAILVLILYVSLISVFSLETIDKFEDPRGDSINVEKLH